MKYGPVYMLVILFGLNFIINQLIMNTPSAILLVGACLCGYIADLDKE